MEKELTKLVRKNILNLSPYSSARDEFSGKNGYFLDANENPYGKWNRYPDPYQNELKTRISEIKNINSKNIFLGNGSDEVIDILIRIFCNPGKDKILTFSPTYGMYKVSAEINDIGIFEIPLNKDFQIDTDENLMRELSDNAIKIVFLCSPNNPTANLISENTIRFILKHFNGVVVIDEAYIDFSEKESWLSEIKNHRNLVVMQTFSKYWGMAGLRIGMCFADEEIIGYMNKVKPPYNISQINQKEVLEAISDTKKFQDQLEILQEEKKNLIRKLPEFSFVQKIFPSDANFLLVKVKDANFIYDELVKQNIIVRNRHSVAENCLRITVGNPDENQKLLIALTNIENL